jgi:homoprotocatechuate degradation regulator HpaR
LTEQQWRILRALSSTETIEATELAHVSFLLAPSLSRILRDLEVRKLIERRTVEGEAARQGVYSTKGGLIQVVAPTSEAIYASIGNRCGAGKLAKLQKMLGELDQSLTEVDVVDH